MPKAEKKREAFTRLATKRTNAVLEGLRVLEHCSNPNLYEYSPEDVKKIFKAIEDEVKKVKLKFMRDTRSEFKL